MRVVRIGGVPVATAAALGVGIALRLALFLDRPSLFSDEAMLALNIARRSYGGMALPLDLSQAASVPFLWVERAAIDLFGVTDTVLRLPSLAGGLCLLWAVWLLSRRLASPAGAFFTVTIVATSPFLLRYSAEIKPYGLDALVGTVLLLSVLHWEESPASWPQWLVTTAVGILAILASLPMIFIAAGTILVMLRARWSDRHRPVLARVMVTGVGWLAAFLIPYLVLYRREIKGPYMQQFWEAGFLTGGPPTPSPPAKVWGALTELTSGAAYWANALHGALPLLVLLTFGCVVLVRRTGLRVGAYLWMPVLLVFGASVPRLYPMSARMLLFLAPAVALGLGEGLAALVRQRDATLRVGGRAVVGFVCALMAMFGVTWATRPPPQEDLRTPLSLLAAERAPGEPVYVFYRTTPAWAFYTTDWSAPDTSRLADLVHWASAGSPGHENGPSRGSRPPGESGLTRPLSGPEGGVEVLGVASGSQARAWQGYVPDHPDDGWAENEAARIREAARPRAWLLLANYHNASEGERLLAAITTAGGSIVSRSAPAPGAALIEVRFSGAPPAEPR